jgi:hypothetical protein
LRLQSAAEGTTPRIAKGNIRSCLGGSDTYTPAHVASAQRLAHAALHALREGVVADPKVAPAKSRVDAAFPGYDSAYVPLHYYFIQAMDALYANLTSNVPLPPSQVVRTTPRGGTPGQAPAITSANVPAISTTPAASNQITFSANTVTIPN